MGSGVWGSGCRVRGSGCGVYQAEAIRGGLVDQLAVCLRLQFRLDTSGQKILC